MICNTILFSWGSHEYYCFRWKFDDDLKSYLQEMGTRELNRLDKIKHKSDINNLIMSTL